MNIKYRIFTEKDKEQVRHIMDVCFGPEDYSDEVVFSPRNVYNVCAEIDGQVVAIASIGEIKEKDQEWYSDYTKVDKLVSLNYVCVLPEYRKLGIASKMVKLRLQMAYYLGYEGVCALAWKSSKGIHMDKILSKEGFKQMDVFKMPWEGIFCIDCDGPCKCDGVFYLHNDPSYNG